MGKGNNLYQDEIDEIDELVKELTGSNSKGVKLKVEVQKVNLDFCKTEKPERVARRAELQEATRNNLEELGIFDSGLAEYFCGGGSEDK